MVDSLEIVNLGVWQAAINTAAVLLSKNISSELWFPAVEHAVVPEYVAAVPLHQLSMQELKEKIHTRQLDKNNTIIVTHGCWRFATRWAAHLRSKGFAWIYTPQGMLEPWPMQHKYLKKKIYYYLVEKRLASKASVIRAVSQPEKKNLQGLFSKNIVQLIPNGVVCAPAFIPQKSTTVLHFVFMARLHSKKGIVPLVKAWLESSLLNNNSYRLTIAGPDEGELPVVQSLIAHATNIAYIGLVSGAEKDKLLASASYYVLPSFSEGFPTSLLEAMEKGAIPVITSGCNFNEVFEQALGYEITTDQHNIKNMLEQLAAKGPDAALQQQYARCYHFIKDNYTLERIAALQYALYTSLLNRTEGS